MKNNNIVIQTEPNFVIKMDHINIWSIYLWNECQNRIQLLNVKISNNRMKAGSHVQFIDITV